MYRGGLRAGVGGGHDGLGPRRAFGRGPKLARTIRDLDRLRIDASNPYAFLIPLGVLGLGPLPLIAILVDETDNAFADVYSAAVSVQNLSPRRRQAATIVAASLLGIAGAGYLVATGQGIGGPY